MLRTILLLATFVESFASQPVCDAIRQDFKDSACCGTGGGKSVCVSPSAPAPTPPYIPPPYPDYTPTYPEWTFRNLFGNAKKLFDTLMPGYIDESYYLGDFALQHRKICNHCANCPAHPQFYLWFLDVMGDYTKIAGCAEIAAFHPRHFPRELFTSAAFENMTKLFTEIYQVEYDYGVDLQTTGFNPMNYKTVGGAFQISLASASMTASVISRGLAKSATELSAGYNTLNSAIDELGRVSKNLMLGSPISLVQMMKWLANTHFSFVATASNVPRSDVKSDYAMNGSNLEQSITANGHIYMGGNQSLMWFAQRKCLAAQFNWPEPSM